MHARRLVCSFDRRIKDTREESLERLTKIIGGEKQKLLGIREVPVYDVCIDLVTATREAMPHIVQVFIGKGDESLDADSFERKLYVIGKRAKRKSERAVLTTISISHHYLQERLYIKVCLHLIKLMNFTLTLKMWIWKRQSHLCTHVSQPTHSRLGKERIRTDTLSITAKSTLIRRQCKLGEGKRKNVRNT